MSNNKTIAYKGFKPGLTCRDFQYKEGETYKHDGPPVKCTDSGFHSCEYPLDVLSYYSPTHSVYHTVELSGVIDRDGTRDCDSKIA